MKQHLKSCIMFKGLLRFSKNGRTLKFKSQLTLAFFFAKI